MMIKSKSMIALGALTAVLLASANPSFAKTVHHRTHVTQSAPVPWQGYRNQGPFAYAPGYRAAPYYSDERAHSYIPRAEAPYESWDGYGQRWD
jgi:hypothetical protein